MKKLKKESEILFLWPLLNFLIFFSYASSLLGMPAADEPTNQDSALPTEFPSEPVPEQSASGAPEMQNMIPSPGTAPSPDSAPEGMGLETIQVSDEKIGDQGNWVKKKTWLLKSYEISNNIFSLANQIAQTKSIYQGKYYAIDEELDKFYKDLGLEQGKAKELFDGVNRYLEKKKKNEASGIMAEAQKPGERDRDFRAKIEILESQIKGLSKDLEQLRLNIEAIADIDKNALTECLKIADKEITASMTLAESAKTKIEAQWDIIDDKKARAIYYEVLNIEEELKSKLSYLKDPLAEYFNKYIDLAKEKISEATATIKKLEEKGIIVKDRAQRVDELKLAELQKLELEAAQPKKVEAPKVEVKKVQELGFVQKIYNFVVNSIAKAYNFILNIFSKKTVAQKTSPVTKQEAQTGLTPTQTLGAGGTTPLATTIPTALPNAPTPVMVQNAPITMPLAEEIPTSIPER